MAEDFLHAWREFCCAGLPTQQFIQECEARYMEVITPKLVN